MPRQDLLTTYCILKSLAVMLVTLLHHYSAQQHSWHQFGPFSRLEVDTYVPDILCLERCLPDHGR